MARGRPPMSDEDKQRKKDEKAAALLSTASAKLPAERERRDELRQQKADLKEDVKDAGKKLADHVKVMRDGYGFLPKAEKINDILHGMSDVEFSATIEQVALRQQEMGRAFQLSMFMPQPGKGSTDAGEEKAVFDNTPTGSRAGGEPSKPKKASAPPTAPVDTGRLTEDEALKVFGENQHKAPKPISQDEQDEADLRARFMKQGEESEAEMAKTDDVVVPMVRPKPKPKSAGKSAKPKGGATKGNGSYVTLN